MIGCLSRANWSTPGSKIVYTVPNGKETNLAINLCNRNNKPILYRMCILFSSETAEVNEGWIEYDCSLYGGETYVRDGMLLNAGQKLLVSSDRENLSCQIFGIEEDILI